MSNRRRTKITNCYYPKKKKKKKKKKGQLSNIICKGKCLQFSKPAPLGRLTLDLNLTSHPKDGVINNEKNFKNLYVTV